MFRAPRRPGTPFGEHLLPVYLDSFGSDSIPAIRLYILNDGAGKSSRMTSQKKTVADFSFTRSLALLSCYRFISK